MNERLNKDILIIGLGSQASAWFLNLRDSKRSVDVFLRENSKSHSRAQTLKANIINEPKSFKNYQFILLLIPDDQHPKFFEAYSSFLMEGQTIIYAHGYSVHYQNLAKDFPQLNHLLLAPKAIASEVRMNYELKKPMAAVISLEHTITDLSDRANKLCQDLGVTEILNRSFKEETEADLFSEQSILCSLIPFGAKKVFEKLVASGISSEVAYIEAWHEVRLIANAMVEFGPTGFFELISPNAFIGGYKAKSLIFNEKFDEILDDLQDDITSRKFFQEVENTDFQSLKNTVIKELVAHPINKVYQDFGKKLK